MQRVLVFADPLALVDDFLEQADQIAAGRRPALEEADAFADAVPRPGNDLLAERDDPVVLDIDLHFLAGVGKALVDQERLIRRRTNEPPQELAREHDIGVHDQRGLARDQDARERTLIMDADVVFPHELLRARKTTTLYSSHTNSS